MPNVKDFAVASCQATLFTPEADVSGSKFISQLFGRWAVRFDAEPTLVPLPEGVPKELPKILLESKDHSWRCEVASGRINIFWKRIGADGPPITVRSFHDIAVPMLVEYRAFVNSPVRRLAAVVNRYAFQTNPAVFLSRHFCQERWLSAPLNRPENFELHAHKQFRLGGKLNVNSWVRNKTGALAGTDVPIVVVEQDLNTPGEDSSNDFNDVEMRHFYDSATAEFDSILGLYYPD